MIWKKFREERANCITMKFVKSLFLAVVCVCAGCFLFVTDGFAKDADAQCLKGGQYDYCIGGHHCKPCPAECYCEATTATVSCSGLPKIWCNASAQSMWQEAGGGLSNGSFGIKLCPDGYPKSANGADSITKCYAEKIVCSQAGKYVKDGTGHCNTSCPAGHYCAGNETHTDVYYNQNRGISGDCGPGKYSSAGAASCSLCSAGSASSGTANASCTKCDAGKCSSASGGSCSGANGKGSTQCMKCPSGTYSLPLSQKNGNLSGNSECKQCFGQIQLDSNGYAIDCKKCPVGKYYDGSSCVNADEGYCTIDDENNCTGDEDGAHAQRQCPAGTCSSKNGEKCAGEGQTGASYCMTCPANTTSSKGSSFCEACPEGQYVENNECKECDNGRYITEDGECVSACEDTKDNGGHIIIARYIDGAYCRTCPAFNNKKPDGTGTFDTGKRYNREGISSCMYMYETSNCKFYYKYDDTVSKYVLGSGGYPPWSDENYYVKITSGVASGQTPTCVKCPESKPFSDEGTGEIEKCHVCEAGSCISGNSCKKCSAGYICPGDSSGNATNCGNGFGEYYGEKICPVNSFSNAGATKCTYCAANYTTIGSEGWCSRPSVGTGCGSSLACQMKKTKLCYILNEVWTCNNNDEGWPSCIIEGKIDKSVLKQQTTN